MKQRFVIGSVGAAMVARAGLTDLAAQAQAAAARNAKRRRLRRRSDQRGPDFTGTGYNEAPWRGGAGGAVATAATTERAPRPDR
jgi:hypothetical protein